MNKVAIISGRFPRTTFESPINHKIYADTYGYTYIHCNWPTKAKANPYLNKIYYILSYIDMFDYIVWIDDDAFFIDFEQDIMDFKPISDTFISFCKSPDFKSLKTYLSSGQFIVKSNAISKQFFNAILHQDLSVIKKKWTENLGFFTNGDQDIMVYLLRNDVNYMNKYVLYNYKTFNSRYENIDEQDIHKPLILHFTGRPEIKKKNLLKAQLKLKLTAPLVSDFRLVNYGIVKVKRNLNLIKKIKKLLKKLLK